MAAPLRRMLALAVSLVVLSLLFLPQVGHAAGRAPSKAWVNHDKDNWGGWSESSDDPRGCDTIDPAQCMLPYPNDWFTKADSTSATGRRLDLNQLAMPRNVEGKPIETQEWNRSDGFSAGAQILTVVPGMTKNADLVLSGLPPVTDLALNDSPNLGVILLDATTGKRWPVWVEIDQYTEEAGLFPAGTVGSVQQDLMIHPATNLLDGHRYIVGLRHLVTDDGSAAKPSDAFVAYRDGKAPKTDPRAKHYAGIFANLREAGWSTKSLYLAWDFTTASTRNVTGRLTAIRDDAFAQLGQKPGDSAKGVVTKGSTAPAFTVDSVANFSVKDNPLLARRITGSFTVPCYIAPTCSPPVKCQQPTGGIIDDCPSPGQFALDLANPDATPQQVAGQTYQANFICNVGRTAFEHHQLLRPVEYGHGLFGGADEVNANPQQQMADKFGMMYCATDWFGFATADVPNAVAAIQDLSRFNWLTDRTQQGELDFLYLQRLMIHPKGFASDPAFQYDDHTSFIDRRGVFYDGNSQGGIYGGVVCAISIDVKRCVLGVPGMDYSILLPRSSDYVATTPLYAADPSGCDPSDPTSCVGYSNALDTFYPDQSQRMLILDLIQTLWDRADPNGYATHMTSAATGGLLEHTPDHHVLLQVAWGDHQVANITAEDEARSIGAAAVEPGLLTSRLSSTDGSYTYAASSAFWGLSAIDQFPYDGSAIVLFDSGPPGATDWGTEPPPPSDTPNRSGKDPHEAPRRSCAAQAQKSAFLSVGGLVIQPPQPGNPGAPPYFAGGWNGTCKTD